MKKVFIIAFCLLLLVGCNKKEEVVEKKEPVVDFVLEKIDSSKEYVYYSNYREVVFKEENYLYKYPVVNIKGNDIENLNLELKNFVINSFKESEVYENKLSSGDIIDYKDYVTDAYVSIVMNYYTYIDGIVGDLSSNTYVVSLSSGKILSNEKLLELYDFTEESFYKELEKNIDSEDVAYSIKNIKENGYNLYVNDKGKLCVIYYELTDFDEIKKELIFD